MIQRCVSRSASAVCLALLSAGTAAAQPARWDELTAGDWPKAMEKSNQTCILPIGILEKHGLHGPLGSDLIQVRELAARATKQEYAVVFPDYFYGQIYESKHQPGTFALPSRVVWDLLDATVEEIGRNGFKRIVIINGHGGNPNLLRYFAQAQLERRRSYALYFFDPTTDPVQAEKVRQARKSDPAGDQHGGENETSTLLYLRPDLVQQARAKGESGANLKRLQSAQHLYRHLVVRELPESLCRTGRGGDPRAGRAHLGVPDPDPGERPAHGQGRQEDPRAAKGIFRPRRPARQIGEPP